MNLLIVYIVIFFSYFFFFFFFFLFICVCFLGGVGGGVFIDLGHSHNKKYSKTNIFGMAHKTFYLQLYKNKIYV